jgi:hypothetical protein
VHTKSAEQEQALLRAFFSLLLFERRTLRPDRALGAVVDDGGAGTSNALSVFARVHGERLGALKQRAVRPILHKTIERAKTSLGRIELPPMTRASLFRLLNELKREQTPAEARLLIERLLAFGGAELPTAALTRLSGVLQNALHKLEFADDFFERHFHAGELERLGGLGTEELETESVTLSLYPAKDLMDFLKAIPSGDCSWWEPTAEAHTGSPRFLNIRVFLERDWIGNIYLLDYSSDRSTVVIDRVQFARAGALRPVRFVPDLLLPLCSRLEQAVPGCRLLAAAVISNSELIQRAWASYAGELPRTEFVFDACDANFECAEGSDRLVVLAGDGTHPSAGHGAGTA